MSEPAGSCNGCGRCCDPVVSVITPTLIELGMDISPALTERDKRWYFEELTMLPQKEGRARTADYLKQGGVTYMSVFENGVWDNVTLISHYYECSNYDRETRLCKSYDDRPSACFGYPWYDRGTDLSVPLPPECGYRKDQGLPIQMSPRHN